MAADWCPTCQCTPDTVHHPQERGPQCASCGSALERAPDDRARGGVLMPAVVIPPEGRWGIDVRYAEGRQQRHWVRPGTQPDCACLEYQTHRSPCGAPTWLTPQFRLPPVWADWPRCPACVTAEQQHTTTREGPTP